MTLPTPKEPTRTKIGVRMDLIPGDVLLEIAKVFAHGAEKYGDNNWKQARLTGDKSALNHCLKHLACYQAGIPDDDGDDPNIHLSHAIVNLMFELHYNLNPEKYK
jgi:hypothetical protein